MVPDSPTTQLSTRAHGLVQAVNSGAGVVCVLLGFDLGSLFLHASAELLLVPILAQQQLDVHQLQTSQLKP